MTASRYVTVWCDGPDCVQWCTATGSQHTAVDARKAAAAVGWSVQRPGGRDLCPDCWRDLRATPTTPATEETT